MNSFKTLASPRRTLIWSFGLTLLCALILWSTQVRAEVAASVHFVGGLVTATASGQSERELAKGGEIYDSDEVNTAYNGRVQMRFTDGGLVSLMPNTTFTVEEYRLGAGNGEDGALIFGLLRGGLRTVTGAIGKTKHDNYQLKTPVGTLGIRGTEFIVVIGPPGTLRVHVGRGKVVITNSYGSLEVPEGHNAVVTLGSAPMLSEEGPVFLAISPIGDSGSPLGMVRQDPYALELPLAGVVPAFLPSGPGYMMAYSGNVSGSGTAVFDGTGALTSFSGATLPNPLITAGAVHNVPLGLSWGTFDDSLNPFPILGMSFTPYIIGQAITTQLTGTLSYSLSTSMDAYAISNAQLQDTGTLSRFDLALDLGGQTSTLNIQLDMQNMGSFTGSGMVGNFTPGGIADFGATFGPGQVVYSGGGSGCGSAGCSMSISGMFTDGGAGVTYGMNADLSYITGVAPLKKQ